MLHLIHPALVHFSVAFLVLGGVAEAWGLLARREALARFGGRLLLVGSISLVPTIVSGYLAANTVEIDAAGHEVLHRHELTGWILLGSTVALLFWKAWCRGRVPEGHDRFYALLLVIAVLLAGYGAWLGGRMVYGHGVGVLGP